MNVNGYSRILIAMTHKYECVSAMQWSEKDKLFLVLN